MVSVKKLEHYGISKESSTLLYQQGNWETMVSVKKLEHYGISKETRTLWYQ